jgi:hypothetical protein
MRSFAKYSLTLSVVLTVSVLLSGCGAGGPQGPAPGTPEFNWLRAQDAYRAGDYSKAADLMADLSKTEHPYTDRAQASAAVLSLGLANAYMELADKLDDGGKRSPNPAPFRRLSNQYRAQARAGAMKFTEVAHHVTASKREKQFVFVFDPPEAGFEDPQQYKKFSIGQLVPDAELGIIEKGLVKREILRNICQALNAPKDPQKARAAYQNGEAKVDSQTFLLMLADGLYSTAEMFGPKKLDQPHRVKLVYDEALEALAMVKDNKQAAELTKKIAQSRKKLNL